MTMMRLLCAAVLVCHATALRAVTNRDVLLHIVQECIHTDAPNYCQRCRSPRAQAACTSESVCKKTTEVWASNTDYVAIRDIKMCGCPSSFVHGLVLPFQTITGVEDPLRPEGIWQFAWDVAIQRMDTSSLALVVNPQNFRSQNQLHVHLVRLQPQAREHFKSFPSAIIPQLSNVWQKASELATQYQLKDYGLLVSQNETGEFRVVITAYSPEDLFTNYVCR